MRLGVPKRSSFTAPVGTAAVVVLLAFIVLSPIAMFQLYGLSPHWDDLANVGRRRRDGRAMVSDGCSLRVERGCLVFILCEYTATREHRLNLVFHA